MPRRTGSRWSTPGTFPPCSVAVRAGSRFSAREEGAAPPLGVNPDHAYRAFTTQLDPGDVVVMFTDGVSEATDARNRQFGSLAIRKTVAAAPSTVPEVGDAILKAVRQHAAGRPQSDDIALVCFGRTEGSSSS